MASSKPRVLTYHVAPHFNITATGGALRLGTVVKNLVELVPLNKQEAEYEPVPDSEIYTPTPQAGFHATRQQLLAGKFGAWAEGLGLSGVGGHTSAGGDRSNKETFSCDNIVTTYFDPTDEWAAKCLAAQTVQEYIIGSRYRKPVYIITGLKVATNLIFSFEAAENANADTKAGVSVPQTSVAVGIEGTVNTEKNQSLGFQSTGIVVGFRVKKYRYKRRSPFSRDKKLEGELFTEGAEMLDDKARPTKNLAEFEDVTIDEEIEAQREAEKQHGSLEECWVKRIRSSDLA
ncbi:hypothetical protein TGAM01_v210297 [Trichoderma gamsii]|uniref:Uncharacterized protein n=1 Tax=Trichoderma gamsii TaxID=398673 RepID=A0A2P4Z8Z7_9HYPO|nr:hypothetical protein TGAM01_v210297 [Trichoderma gamsii]PON20789.1 hypothetical protein TGAM01_v210297 [Trichoderma gamsii]